MPRRGVFASGSTPASCSANFYLNSPGFLPAHDAPITACLHAAFLLPAWCPGGGGFPTPRHTARCERRYGPAFRARLDEELQTQAVAVLPSVLVTLEAVDGR